MRDKISIERVESLHPDKKENFIAFIEELEETFDTTLRVVQAFRSFKQQDELYAQGRSDTSKPKVTNARGGESFHCYGLAVDIIPLSGTCQPQWNYDFEKFKPIAEKYGLTWGGSWKDYDHYEDNLGFGPSGWRHLLTTYQNKQVDDKGFLKLETLVSA